MTYVKGPTDAENNNAGNSCFYGSFTQKWRRETKGVVQGVVVGERGPLGGRGAIATFGIVRRSSEPTHET
jgi:hypothetical protein